MRRLDKYSKPKHVIETTSMEVEASCCGTILTDGQLNMDTAVPFKKQTYHNWF